RHCLGSHAARAARKFGNPADGSRRQRPHTWCQRRSPRRKRGRPGEESMATTVTEQRNRSQAETLAEQFERANAELLAAVRGYSDIQWQATCPSQGWTVGVSAHHLAVDH